MKKNHFFDTMKVNDTIGGDTCTVTAVPDGYGKLRFFATTGKDTDHFSDLDQEDQATVLEWLGLNCLPGDTPAGANSYGMKHVLERRTGLYLTNNQFKESMMELGFLPVEVDTLNWDFYLDSHSPIFRSWKDGSRGVPLGEKAVPYPQAVSFYDWMLAKYLGKDTPRGDLAYDMRHERYRWPEENTEEAIIRYLESCNACRECIRTFKACWKSYKLYCEMIDGI